MPNHDSKTRFALYYTPPPEHPLTIAASRWLGRDAFEIQPSMRDAMAAEQRDVTAEPARYGFHATIKAPFRLREERTVVELQEATRIFCDSRPICPIGSLRIARIGQFFALVPETNTSFLGALASSAVTDLDQFRAPMSESELQRRLESNLDDIETINLVRWGYPYVFDRFRFHMTLTGPVEASRCDHISRELDSVFGRLLNENFRIDALTLFVQQRPEADFTTMTRFPLRSPQLLKAI